MAYSVPSNSLLSPVARMALGIALLTMLAYADSFTAPFLFDDGGAIIDNTTIRQFSTALEPLINGTPVSGRPLVNLTLALNYATSGLGVWSYHAVNLTIHILAALTLLGLVHRTLLLPSVAPRYRDSALEIAAVVALLWAVHPMQTESVTYLSQRAESLMGLFYLLTLYGFVRGEEEGGLWPLVSLGACLAGMASKEVMISAPLIVLLYDRTFCAGSFVSALRMRAGYYLTLSLTWLLLAAEMAHVGSRGGSIGKGLKIDSWHYLLTQCHALALYLGLSLFPFRLTFDYGATTISSIAAVWPEGLIVVLLLFMTLCTLLTRSALGFIGAWFFAVLAPSSSVIPIATQTIAEHRMYLPLASVILLFVLMVYHFFGRARIAAILAVPLIALTLLRNADYVNGLTLWNQSVDRYPDNTRAHINLGNAEVQAGLPRAGKREFEAALKLDPNLAEAHNNLGVVEAGLGQTADAEKEYREAMRISPSWDKPRQNLEHLEATATNAPPQ